MTNESGRGHASVLHHPRFDARVGLPIIAAAVVFLFLGMPLAAAVATSGSADPSGQGPISTGTTTSASQPGAIASPSAAGTFSPYCYKIDTTVCVSAKYFGETNIVPSAGGTVCNAEPNATQSLPLIVKSRYYLNWTNAPRFGKNSPVALNVTGTLWNGDPYYSVWSNTVWHANANTWWTFLGYQSQNQSYPYWYEVNMTARGLTGAVNFFPGMTINWWIALTYNTSGVFTHHEGPHFQCTFSGAWPYSPYRGTPQYAGSSAITLDTSLLLTPRSPNWNDTVRVTLNTTQADVAQNATIGSAYIDLSETSPTGVPIQNGTVRFPVVVNANSFGAVTSTAIIPASYSQVAGALINFRLTVADVPGDTLVSVWQNYSVGANGSFASGIFTDDLAILTIPSSVENGLGVTPVVNPGQIVNVSLQSRSPGTSINFAEIAYTLGYPNLNEHVFGTIPLVRTSSTEFSGHLPGFPLGTNVNFTVLAWDFSQRLEVSPTLQYSVPSFSVWVPLLPTNSTFFFVYVFDNGSGKWVNGATVQIVGPHGFYNTLGNTTLGVDYPNVTRSPYLPLLLPANQTYNVTVTDPWFIPAAAPEATSVSVTIVGLHTMAARQTLAVGAHYIVVQEGNSILFFLNATPPAPTVSPSTGGSAVPVAPILALVATFFVALALLLWWRQIRAKRREEEKRVTL